MQNKARLEVAAAPSFVLALVVIISGMTQPTTKILSTNFTLVNLGDGEASGSVEYYLPDGSLWGDGSEGFTITDPGGQAIFRQYDNPGKPGNPNLTIDAGSVIVTATQPLGAVVQILARGQDPTSSGAYSGFERGDTSFYVPLAAKELDTASGAANSQIVVQNTGSITAANIEIEMIGSDGTSTYVKSRGALEPGAAYYYDLALEDDGNVPDGWYGSAVARTTTPGAEIAVVSNFFTGDAMQTFNAFGSSAPGTTWFVPLFISRLSCGGSSPIAVQNLSGTAIAAGGVEVTCIPDSSAVHMSPFVMTNNSAIDPSASYFFNPVTDMSIPETWYGSCIVESAADVVAFVQMRFVGGGEAAAYEAIPAGGTDTRVVVPLVAKRLENGFATAVTIQNLNTVMTATVDITYTRSSDCTVGDAAYTFDDVEIAPGASLIHNHRITIGASDIPDGWYGTMVVEGDQVVHGFVQLTFLRHINPALPWGDNFMAHNAFTGE